jgi:hypothetical protein
MMTAGTANAVGDRAFAVVHAEDLHSHPRYRGYSVFKERVSLGSPQKRHRYPHLCCGLGTGRLKPYGFRRSAPIPALQKVGWELPVRLPVPGPTSYAGLTVRSRPVENFPKTLCFGLRVASPDTTLPLKGRKR